MILTALTEAKSPFWRSIKYSLFPPLGLATLAAYLDPDDEVSICDDHVEMVSTDDAPDIVVIQAYITSAFRSYEIADLYRARGVHVCIGGLHATSMPQEAAEHADTVFIGPGEDTWPAFLADYRAGTPRGLYISARPTLDPMPFPRRDLIKRSLYLVPNSIVVSRGCPHRCGFCYQSSFYKSWPSVSTPSLDRVLAEIESLPGRHLYFLDDNFFGNGAFARRLMDGMRGMNRIWQAAGSVDAVLTPGMMDRASACGLRSLFVGFETLDDDNLANLHKCHNRNRDYGMAVRRMHDAGVMVNASFIFGMDADGPDVFRRTVDWAVAQGVETATFHILTPYPGTPLFHSMQAEGRLTSRNWDLYDTRHAVFRPRRMSAGQLEAGYRRAYREFYSWGNILRTTIGQGSIGRMMRHGAYTTAWKKLELFWDVIVRIHSVSLCTPVLESVLAGIRPQRPGKQDVSREESAPEPDQRRAIPGF